MDRFLTLFHIGKAEFPTCHAKRALQIWKLKSSIGVADREFPIDDLLFPFADRENRIPDLPRRKKTPNPKNKIFIGIR